MNAYEFLLKKGVRKVHQPDKQYNLSVAELIQFLEEYSTEKKSSPDPIYNKNNPPQTLIGISTFKDNFIPLASLRISG